MKPTIESLSYKKDLVVFRQARGGRGKNAILKTKMAFLLSILLGVRSMYFQKHSKLKKVALEHNINSPIMLLLHTSPWLMRFMN